MSNTAQASGKPPVAASAPGWIGTPPLKQASWLFIVIGPGIFMLGAMMVGSERDTAIIVVLGLIPWGIASLWCLVRLLGLVAVGSDSNYAQTKAAIRKGRIGVSYFIRDWLGNNVIVVDESRRLLCLNGDLFGFDDVKTVGWQSANNKHQLEFTLKSGADPLRIVTLNTVDEVKAAFARLGNSLGFS